MSEVHGSEVWRDVVGFEGLYKVSSHGRVKSLERHQSRSREGMSYSYLVPEKILSTYKGNKSGHLQVDLGKGHRVSVHRLVLEAFVGPCPKGMICCHEDGNPSNNFLGNLRWGTWQDNAEDGKRLGEYKNGPKGETHPFAKLTEDLVRQIRQEYAEENTTLKKLSEKHNVHIMTLSDLLRGKTWKHVD